MVEIRQNHVASKASSMMLIYWLSASDFFQLCTVDFFFLFFFSVPALARRPGRGALGDRLGRRARARSFAFCVLRQHCS